MKPPDFIESLNLRKILATATILTCTLAVSSSVYAKEDTYLCRISSLPGNPTETVTASSESEAVKKATKIVEDDAKKIYGITSLNIYCKKK
ncbi:hypothetical protein GCM10009091_14590 [Pseudomonas brenneri]|uniref:Uncharacterized protein n=1 Tax=Pseudomonas brenneri TaxID=129817 RepID=A0A5B2V3U4_9PSED|nr:hypothetical protein [Pseudomonas brenneri]KAA2232887.1 hypothetical protein F1720_04850 [Pseudomonas brenneri]TWR77818.1 hypothetical protein FJD34_14130 [Pseudomonas brenneri]GGL33898.1 hypothetical protein GCM10009091_14590 [Pseudomonas brenneri]SDV07025.1 hypothetical protein SAMN04490181_4125 [Pseudomonas brenneri]